MSTFITQGYIELVLETGLDLTGATDPIILYQTPAGVKGSWVATVAGTTLTYQLANTTIMKLGTWKFQSFVKIGGLNAYGNVVELTFERPLNH